MHVYLLVDIINLLIFACTHAYTYYYYSLKFFQFIDLTDRQEMSEEAQNSTLGEN